MLNLMRLIASIIALAFGSTAWSATLTVNSDGVLTGASNVIVNGQAYDVSFENGSCNSLYNGCDQNALAFSSVAEAIAAANALLNQVLIDGPMGNFDSETDNVIGCTFDQNCLVRIAGAVIPPDSIAQAVAINLAGNGLDSVFDEVLGADNNAGSFSNVSFATFTAVPLPAALPLFLAGLGGFGLFSRRKKKQRSFN